MLAGNQPALQIASEAIGAVGSVLEDAQALAGRVLHPLAGVNVAEQEIAALLPPHRAFSRSEFAAEPGRQLFDRLIGGDDFFELRRKLIDPLAGLRPGHTVRQNCCAGGPGDAQQTAA
jgi:hypothetical protein